jgi:hypothetical protein
MAQPIFSQPIRARPRVPSLVARLCVAATRNSFSKTSQSDRAKDRPRPSHYSKDRIKKGHKRFHGLQGKNFGQSNVNKRPFTPKSTCRNSDRSKAGSARRCSSTRRKGTDEKRTDEKTRASQPGLVPSLVSSRTFRVHRRRVIPGCPADAHCSRPGGGSWHVGRFTE